MPILPTMEETTDPDVLAYAEEIRRYLDARPNAADSLKGVVWWLTKSKLEQDRLKIRSALEYLVREGVVIRMNSDSGKRSSKTGSELEDPYMVYAINRKGKDVSN
jgi:hypothetical protein